MELLIELLTDFYVNIEVSSRPTFKKLLRILNSESGGAENIVSLYMSMFSRMRIYSDTLVFSDSYISELRILLRILKSFMMEGPKKTEK
jgi:hypothetical protein